MIESLDIFRVAGRLRWEKTILWYSMLATHYLALGDGLNGVLGCMYAPN